MPCLPRVDFCGFQVARLVLGANPFGGFSHQNPDRDAAMRAYYTVDRILETWERARTVGIDTVVTNNESPHVLEALRAHRAGRAPLQWIAQLNTHHKSMEAAIDEAVEIGCSAFYFHGGVMDALYRQQDEATLRQWVTHARRTGVPVGVAGHIPAAHFWVDSLDLVDFHAVCFFNCGSLHFAGGERFLLEDMARAVACIQELRKPCIGYKILGAGRIDARMGFEHAFANIKPGDVVNVGMYRGDRDDMVEANVAIAAEILGRGQAA